MDREVTGLPRQCLSSWGSGVLEPGSVGHGNDAHSPLTCTSKHCHQQKIQCYTGICVVVQSDP